MFVSCERGCGQAAYLIIWTTMSSLIAQSIYVSALSLPASVKYSFRNTKLCCLILNASLTLKRPHTGTISHKGL